ncbi:YtpI family protein [Paenibacillus sp. FSL R7-0331]|uniref:YtpI family protein n=1 Tax=Paenibacillus sp. FSL R7-0331 TaxID=1536773 RepID=UPI0004F5A090|nr:YtpI family protein [Paenibacillus sp. FSL R7-0331]AIQ51844.1 hypothetical protein R70331_10180 [Paenibacillus sp. FSL R7-0331]
MIMLIKYLLFILLVVFMIGAAAFSLSSRRTSDPAEKARRRSVMNVLLGAMLVTLSLMSMFLFRGSTLSVIVEAVFLVIGAFNIFSGLRSYGYYSRDGSRKKAS